MKLVKIIIPIHLYILFYLLFVCVFLLSVCSKNDFLPDQKTYTDYEFKVPEITGTTFYIDPEHGSPDGDGSAGNPWRTLQEVAEAELITHYRQISGSNELELVNEEAPVKGGDCLVLKSGYHGYFKRNVFIFDKWLTISGADGEKPVLSQFRIEGAFAKVFLKNIVIAKDSYNGAQNYWEADAVTRNSNACVYLRSDDFWGAGHDMKFKNITAMTTENTSNWSAEDWVEKAAGGFGIRGVPNVEIIDCKVTNVRMGISLSRETVNARVVNTTIRNYSGDGARVLGDGTYFAYNTITDCYKVDDNHDDGIQSYSVDENWNVGTQVVRNVVLRGNIIIGTTDFDNPLAGSPQGIGCFDGFFDNWVVENNLVIVDHYHGISFYGMSNSIIAHNTVIDQIEGNKTSPWILITKHKDGRPSVNCRAVNNLVERSLGLCETCSNENNLVLQKTEIKEYDSLFVNPDAFDYHLRSNSAADSLLINQGIMDEQINSCRVDAEGTARDASPDLGAYEYVR